jgi:outer membrane protein TolC
VTGCLPSTVRSAWHDQAAELARETPPPDGAGTAPLELREDLTAASLVRAVLERNPDVASAREAWRAALAAFPQETAWEDPSVMIDVAPVSLFPGTGAMPGVMVEGSQRLAWAGRLAARGRAALAEAAARSADLETTRRDLALAAVTLFDALWLARHELEVVLELRDVAAELREGSEARLRASVGQLAEPLSAEVEIARLEREASDLEADVAVLRAELNGLLHRPPDAALPVPADLGPVPTVADADVQRSELRAAAAAVERAEARVDDARLGFLPELEIRTGYNSMWDAAAMRWTVGLGIMLPVQAGARRAALDAARADAARAEAERASVEDRVAVEVRAAEARLVAARRNLVVLDERLLPAAEEQLTARRAAYVTGGSGWLEVLEALRMVREARHAQAEAVAAVHTRTAELVRARGGVPGLDEGVAR